MLAFSLAPQPQPGFCADNGKTTMNLTSIQAAHVAKVFPESRDEMADYLERGVAVCIGPQNECGDDVPPIAIWVVEKPEFFIDCCATVADAKAQAKALGLRIVRTVGGERN